MRESQYFLQIVKYDDNTFCKPIQSDFRSILPIQQENGMLHVVEANSLKPDSDFTPFLVRQLVKKAPVGIGFPYALPYDDWCPSVSKQLVGRICYDCDLYFATKVNADRH